ncbi:MULTISPECIES: hypothetical protein [unclassified Microcoleus]|uniref:hypothetical protein n=1 Tax=unclassified Microcoleus TaxID=2642155 RepID=UPI002FD4FE58
MVESYFSGMTAQPRLTFRTVNPGDIVKSNQTLEEKSQQIAVDAPDITGDRVVVPTYFVVDYPNGEKKALHHVRDAKEISDVIRQMRLHEEVDDPKFGTHDHPTMLSGLSVTLGLLMLLVTLLTGAIVIGVF